MQLTIRLLGAEVLHISTDTTAVDTHLGDATAYPVGFTSILEQPDEARLPDRS